MEARDESEIYAHENASIKAYDEVVVYARDSAHIKAYDNSSIFLCSPDVVVLSHSPAVTIEKMYKKEE